MDDPQAPPIGCRGEVKFIDDSASIHVAWENGSSLALLWGVDRYMKVDKPSDMGISSRKKGVRGMPETEAQKRAREKYEAKTKAGVYLKLNKVTDSDILSKLDSVPNKQGYIKELIRKDIGK